MVVEPGGAVGLGAALLAGLILSSGNDRRRRASGGNVYDADMVRD